MDFEFKNINIFLFRNYVPIRVWELPFQQLSRSKWWSQSQNWYHMPGDTGKLCLIQFVGFFSCLIRSDYNFAVIFFCYFVWQQRKDSLALKIVIKMVIIDNGSYYLTHNHWSHIRFYLTSGLGDIRRKQSCLAKYPTNA